jgi:hypothetical protein
VSPLFQEMPPQPKKVADFVIVAGSGYSSSVGVSGPEVTRTHVTLMMLRS